MTEPFDAAPADAADHGDAPVRPAATLALIRFGARGPEILMGRRRDDLAFMPGRWVFPGGRVDKADGAVTPLAPLRDAVRDRLENACPSHCAAAAGAAAVRETWEETGLLVGAEGPWAAPKGDAWSAFERAQAGPDMSSFVALARAVTPPGRPRRFDARFFLADASRACLGDVEGAPRPADDIAAAEWVPAAKVLDRPVATITRFVHGEIMARLSREDPFDDEPIASLEEFDGRSTIRRI